MLPAYMFSGPNFGTRQPVSVPFPREDILSHCQLSSVASSSLCRVIDVVHKCHSWVGLLDNSLLAWCLLVPWKLALNEGAFRSVLAQGSLGLVSEQLSSVHGIFSNRGLPSPPGSGDNQGQQQCTVYFVSWTARPFLSIFDRFSHSRSFTF